MFNIQCCRLPVLDGIQQRSLPYSRFSYKFPGSHAVFIAPKSFTPPKKKTHWKAVSGEEEILLPHPALFVCLAFRFSQAHHFTNLLSSMCCGCWVQPGRSYHPMEHPAELTCDQTSSLYGGHQAAHWKWSGDMESWLFALLGKAPRDFKSICLPAVRQECSVLSSFLPNIQQEGKFLEDISKPIFKCILSHQPYRIYLPRAIVCNSVQCFFFRL